MYFIIKGSFGYLYVIIKYTKILIKNMLSLSQYILEIKRLSLINDYIKESKDDYNYHINEMKDDYNYHINEMKDDYINGFVILKPEFLDHSEEWLKILQDNEWDILDKQTLTLTNEQAHELYKMHKGKDFYEDLCKYMSSGKCLCCKCYKECADPI